MHPLWTAVVQCKDKNKNKKNVTTVAKDDGDTFFFRCKRGFAGGMIQAVLFNPWDRALYLSVKDRRPFLHLENFTHPYHGFWQSIWYRTFSSGIYFVLQAEFNEHFGSYIEGVRGGHFYLGLSIGAVQGVMLNQMANVRYHVWSKPGSTFVGTSLHMWEVGGMRPFFKGAGATIAREMAWGGSYELIRQRFRLEFANHPFSSDVAAAACATVCSGPFNFVRNIQFATHAGHEAPTTMAVLKQLHHECAAEPSFFRALCHLQQRLRIGWGTARVSLSMALMQWMFDDWLKKYL